MLFKILKTEKETVLKISLRYELPRKNVFCFSEMLATQGQYDWIRRQKAAFENCWRSSVI